MEAFLEDGDEDVDAHGDPNLGLHGILRGAVERLDAQVLLDPFEEQLHTPSRLVEEGDDPRAKEEVVGEEHESPVGFDIEVGDPPQGFGVVGGGIHSGREDGLIAAQSGRPVHGMRVSSLELEATSGAREEESGGMMDGIEPLEMEVATIHHIEGPRGRQEEVQDVDVVKFGVWRCE